MKLYIMSFILITGVTLIFLLFEITLALFFKTKVIDRDNLIFLLITGNLMGWIITTICLTPHWLWG